MSVIQNVTDFFRNVAGSKTIDRYGILSPVMAAESYVETTLSVFDQPTLMKDVAQVLTSSGNKDPLVKQATVAYKDYLNALQGAYRHQDQAKPLSTVEHALVIMRQNLLRIEDNFTALFGSDAQAIDETVLKSSSLIVIGYVEMVTEFCSWVAQIVDHCTATQGHGISPFQSKTMIGKASDMGRFAYLNMSKWNDAQIGFLREITELQKKGADVALKTSQGWMDALVSDSVLSSSEADLLTAALRNPILMGMNRWTILQQNKIELLSARKDWLMSKIVLEQMKADRLDPASANYKRIQKACDHYANVITLYEQKIERMRA